MAALPVPQVDVLFSALLLAALAIASCIQVSPRAAPRC